VVMGRDPVDRILISHPFRRPPPVPAESRECSSEHPRIVSASCLRTGPTRLPPPRNGYWRGQIRRQSFEENIREADFAESLEKFPWVCWAGYNVARSGFPESPPGPGAGNKLRREPRPCWSDARRGLPLEFVGRLLHGDRSGSPAPLRRKTAPQPRRSCKTPGLLAPAAISSRGGWGPRRYPTAPLGPYRRCGLLFHRRRAARRRQNQVNELLSQAPLNPVGCSAPGPLPPPIENRSCPARPPWRRHTHTCDGQDRRKGEKIKLLRSEASAHSGWKAQFSFAENVKPGAHELEFRFNTKGEPN